MAPALHVYEANLLMEPQLYGLQKYVKKFPFTACALAVLIAVALVMGAGAGFYVCYLVLQ